MTMSDTVDASAAEDNKLLARWVALAGPSAAGHGRELINRYREPHRRYHTTAHLAHILYAIDLLDAPDSLNAIDAVETAAEPDAAAAVRFAAWFHDAVYDISDGTDHTTNEERSARLAENVLRSMHSPSALVTEVVRLVRCTADHRVNPDDRNATLLCDADLAILGSDPKTYARYTEQIRDEYRAVPDAQFRKGRTAILRDLLSRPAIYRTPRAQELFEAAARANIAAELEHLEPTP